MKAIGRGRDHCGVKRKESEDIVRVHDDLGLYLVADGSRDPDGRWAAETICDRVRGNVQEGQQLLFDYRASPSREKRLKVEELLFEAIQKACLEIYRKCHVDHAKRPSFTSLEALLVLSDYAISAHVGNTRLYLVRDGKPIKVTREDTLYEEMAQGLPHSRAIDPALKKRLTRCLGNHDSVPVSCEALPLIAGDLLILCTDGLWNAFGADSAELGDLVAKGMVADLPKNCIEFGIAKKAEDNLAALVVEIEGDVELRASIELDSKKHLEILRGIELFRGIRDDAAALSKMHSMLSLRKFAAGEVVVREGAPSDEIFIILKGSVHVSIGGKGLVTRKPFDSIGEMGFFNREPRSATVVAVEPTTALRFHRADYEAMVRRDRDLGYRILEGVVFEVSRKLISR